jgi:WS/DGAT/MGAT family acyltransferase
MTHCEPVTAADRLHLDLDDSHVHMHVGGAFLFDPGPLARGGGIDIERLREFIESRLYLAPRYRQRILRRAGADPVWVDDANFNLLYHVRHTHLPCPGDERQMKRLCGRIASQRLDPEKPLWELYAVEGLEGGRFALVVKVHQCIARGLWEIGLLEALLSEKPEQEVAPAPVWLPRPAPAARDVARASLRERLASPLRFGRAMLGVARDPQQAWDDAGTTLEGFRESEPASETPFNRPIGPHRRYDWLAIDRSKAEALTKRFATTPDAVLLSTLAGAIGRFFEQRGIPVPDQRDLRLRAALPTQPGGLCSGEKPGDTLSWLVSGLPIAELDPVRRLEAVNESLSSATPMSYRLFANASEWLWPGLYAELARRQLAGRTSNLTLTPLSGPSTPRHLLGARLLEAYPLLPLVPDQALRVAVYAYAEGLYWGFNAEWDLLPDLHDLVRAVEDCFQELCTAADELAA